MRDEQHAARCRLECSLCLIAIATVLEIPSDREPTRGRRRAYALDGNRLGPSALLLLDPERGVDRNLETPVSVGTQRGPVSIGLCDALRSPGWPT